VTWTHRLGLIEKANLTLRPKGSQSASALDISWSGGFLNLHLVAARTRTCLARWQPDCISPECDADAALAAPTFQGQFRRLRAHLDGVLAWTQLWVTYGALEGMNNKVKRLSHRSLGFRTVKNFTTAIYHCCAHLPLPEEC
jgi:hypothetical protein